MNNFHFIRLALSNIYRVSEYTVDDALMDQAIRIHIFDLGPVQTSSSHISNTTQISKEYIPAVWGAFMAFNFKDKSGTGSVLSCKAPLLAYIPKSIAEGFSARISR